jgi:hypothetical protein
MAVIGFLAFLIWELTADEPVVDLRVFRHRSFTMSVVTICVPFGAFFGSTFLTPLWLQNYMGYTATQAGIATAATGLLAVLVAPLAASLSEKLDSLSRIPRCDLAGPDHADAHECHVRYDTMADQLPIVVSGRWFVVFLHAAHQPSPVQRG